jgi:hypothetical protein
MPIAKDIFIIYLLHRPKQNPKKLDSYYFSQPRLSFKFGRKNFSNI